MFLKNKKFAQLYSDYYPLVFSTIYTKVGVVEDTEDLCQEIFSKFYEKLEEIENNRKWLFGAIRLEVLTYYRRKKRKEANIEEIFQDSDMVFVNGFRDLRIIIRDAIDRMDEMCDERERLLFDLVAIKRFTYEEAGSQLALNKRQVRYKYNVVTKKLMDYLSTKGITSLEDLL